MRTLHHFAEKSVRPKAAASSRFKLLSATAACVVTMACFAGNATATEDVLHVFKAYPHTDWAGPKGQWPMGGLLPGPSGSFYGTTTAGGIPCKGCNVGFGTVFQMLPPQKQGGSWTEVVLHVFHATDKSHEDGNSPMGPLISDGKGNLYGTTKYGGAFGSGVAYMLSPPSTGSASGDWTYTILHSFGGAGDGGNPQGGLVMDDKGNLFGTTEFGGKSDQGIVYELSSSQGTWTETILHEFKGGSKDGEYPSGALLEKNGILYGTTVQGGISSSGKNNLCFDFVGENDNTCGTVFRLAKDPAKGWVETVLHKFSFQNGDGSEPYFAKLYMDNAGNLFGATSYGGLAGHCGSPFGYLGCGTAFELSPPAKQGAAWTESTLYQFTDVDKDVGSKGYGPAGGLIANEKGELFGLNWSGGLSGSCGLFSNGLCGTVYKLSPESQGKWKETTLYQFKGADHDGGSPTGELVLGADGVLYGTTEYSDSTYYPSFNQLTQSFSGCGTVFGVKP